MSINYRSAFAMQHITTQFLAAATPPADAAAKARQQRLLRQRRRVRQQRLAAPLLALLLLIIWQLAVTSGALSSLILPAPLAIGARIIDDFPELLKHAYVTTFEVSSGFAIAAVLGVATALAIFFSSIFRHAVYPLLVGLQTVPKIALAPLIVLYLGYGWGPKLFLAALLAFFPIVVSTVVGLESIDQGLVRMIASMGAKPYQIFFKVRLPAALPNLFAGLKVGISLAVIGAVLGEYIAAQQGLGYLQLQANANFDTTLNLAAVVVIAVMGTVLYGAIAALESIVTFSRGERA
jgi:NitT/TauT family transport system permease protein